MYFRKNAAVFCLLLLLYGTFAQAGGPPVLAISKGTVSGKICDAQTGLPVKGAEVVIVQQKDLLTSKTDGSGAFKCKAFVGRAATKVKLGLADILFKSPLEIMTGGTTEKTKWVSVTHYQMKVNAKGYKPFQGIVTIQTANAEKMAVSLPLMLLNPEGTTEVSSVAPGWGSVRLLNIVAEPSIIRPGDKITITVRAQGPPTLTIKCKTSPSNPKIVIKELKKPTVDTDGQLTFTTTVKAPAVKTKTTFSLNALIANSSSPVIADFESVRTDIHVVRNDEEAAQAKTMQNKIAGNSKPAPEQSDINRLKGLYIPTSNKTASITIADQDLERAIANAKTHVGSDCKDFAAWHEYGNLLYRKGIRQLEGQHPETAQTFNECREVLIEGLQYQRGAKTTARTSTPTPYNGTVQEIGATVYTAVGFASPEAECDFTMVNNIPVLVKDQKNALTHLDLATALFTIDEMELAEWHLACYRTQYSDCAEGKYLGALICLKKDDTDAGMQLLREVTAVNPNHPKANLILAILCWQSGDEKSAVALLDKHEKHYGTRY
jgi:hypothetical protein